MGNLKVMTKPYTEEEALQYADKGIIKGVLSVDINDIIKKDWEEFYDYLEESLTEHFIGDTDFTIVGYNGKNILLEVTATLYDENGNPIA